MHAFLTPASRPYIETMHDGRLFAPRAAVSEELAARYQIIERFDGGGPEPSALRLLRGLDEDLRERFGYESICSFFGDIATPLNRIMFDRNLDGYRDELEEALLRLGVDAWDRRFGPDASLPQAVLPEQASIYLEPVITNANFAAGITEIEEIGRCFLEGLFPLGWIGRPAPGSRIVAYCWLEEEP